MSNVSNNEQTARGTKCEDCKDVLYYKDELVFLLGNEAVYVSEKYPDWDSAICITCADKKGII